MKNYVIDKSSLLSIMTLALFMGSFAGELLWTLGFHKTRLALLSVSGILMLALFMFSSAKTDVWGLRVWMLLMIGTGLAHLFNGSRSPVWVTWDLAALGMVVAGYNLAGLSRKMLSLCILTLGIVIVLASSTLLANLNATSFIFAQADRSTAFAAFGQDMLAGAVNKSFVYYGTLQGLVGLGNVYLLALPFLLRGSKAGVARAIAIAVVIVILIYALVYQKRQPIVELVMILFLYGFVFRGLVPGLLPKRPIRSMSVILLIIFGFVSIQETNNLVNRFDEQSEGGLRESSRLGEAVIGLKEMGLIQLVIGQGIGYESVNTTGRHVLHVGYANLVMKGGAVFLCLYLVLAFMNLRLAIKAVGYQGRVAAAFTIFSIGCLLYSPVYDWTPNAVVFGLGLFSTRFLRNAD